MQLNHEVHFKAYSGADTLKHAQAILYLGRCDAHSAIGKSSTVKGPDFHAGDPLGQQIAGKALWFVLEGIEVIQRLQFAIASEPGIHIC